MRLCKDGEFYDLVLGGKRIASFKVEGVVPTCFSRDAGEVVSNEGAADIVLVPAQEYEYLLNCEEMLKSLSRLIGDRIENNQTITED